MGQDETYFYDGQKVEALHFEDGTHWTVGQSGIEKIIVIMENGEMASVVWFGVYKDGKLTFKQNRKFVSHATMVKI